MLPYDFFVASRFNRISSPCSFLFSTRKTYDLKSIPFPLTFIGVSVLVLLFSPSFSSSFSPWPSSKRDKEHQRHLCCRKKSLRRKWLMVLRTSFSSHCLLVTAPSLDRPSFFCIHSPHSFPCSVFSSLVLLLNTFWTHLSMVFVCIFFFFFFPLKECVCVPGIFKVCDSCFHCLSHHMHHSWCPWQLLRPSFRTRRDERKRRLRPKRYPAERQRQQQKSMVLKSVWITLFALLLIPSLYRHLQNLSCFNSVNQCLHQKIYCYPLEQLLPNLVSVFCILLSSFRL